MWKLLVVAAVVALFCGGPVQAEEDVLASLVEKLTPDIDLDLDLDINLDFLEPSGKEVVGCGKGVSARHLDLVNRQRKVNGQETLRANAKLSKAAQKHAEDMAEHNFFDHTGSDRSTFVIRAKRAGYRFRHVGENIQAGADKPGAVVARLMESPAHRKNILNKKFTEVGFGCAQAPNSRYRVYWVQVFGTQRK